MQEINTSEQDNGEVEGCALVAVVTAVEHDERLLMAIGIHRLPEIW